VKRREVHGSTKFSVFRRYFQKHDRLDSALELLFGRLPQQARLNCVEDQGHECQEAADGCFCRRDGAEPLYGSVICKPQAARRNGS